MLLLTLVLSAPAFAHETGQVGDSRTGCGGCHGRSADATTSAAFAASATTVYPGDTVDVTLTVSTTDASRTHAGLDVGGSGGTLGPGANNKLSFGEVTHASPQAMSSGSVTFNFSWTAPTSEGTYVLSAAANAVDFDGLDGGDGWNLASDLVLLVDDGCDDLDGDGVSDCAGDCDDGDSAVFPGAPEHCDGVDEDCDTDVDESAVDATTFYTDADGDSYGDPATAVAACSVAAGQVADGSDCDDSLGWVFPGAPDAWYDGVDANCDGANDNDQDADGYDSEASGGDDCDDTEAGVNPSVVDSWYDGVDADCDGASDFDADGDGGDSATYGGDDCDDANPAVYAGAPDDPDDGIIDDCTLRDPGDTDGDGHVADSAGGDDCDDANSQVYGGAAETWYDGTDSDCSGGSDFDQDGDGVDAPEGGGLDCDDLDPDSYPGAPEAWYDGIDQACDAGSDYDQDQDGFDSDLYSGPDGRPGTDCDDVDASASPDGVEVPYDGIDQDCSGADLADVDQDGEDSTAVGGSDCADDNPDVGAEEAEIPYDGIDQDCTGGDLVDVDGDGVPAAEAGGTDCDDTDPAVQACDTGETGAPDDTAGDTASDTAPDPGGDDSGGDGLGSSVEGSACGCATSSSPGLGWLGLLPFVMPLLARRRR